MSLFITCACADKTKYCMKDETKRFWLEKRLEKSIMIDDNNEHSDSFLRRFEHPDHEHYSSFQFIDNISTTNFSIFRLVSAVQAILASSAGAIVCSSSCRRSFLSASHFMSDGYAWFGAAYFIYDLWHMYRVHVCKVNDKLLVHSATINSSLIDNENSVASNNGNNNNGKANIIETDFSYLNDIIVCNRDIYTKRLRSVSDRHVNFIQFCLENPVMIIHHVFLGSFGLFVIVVSLYRFHPYVNRFSNGLYFLIHFLSFFRN